MSIEGNDANIERLKEAVQALITAMSLQDQRMDALEELVERGHRSVDKKLQILIDAGKYNHKLTMDEIANLKNRIEEED